MIKALKASAVFVILLCSQASAEGVLAQGDYKTATLQGGVNQVEVLKPLIKGLSPGMDFKGQTLDSSSSDDWMQIPEWLAGTWFSYWDLQSSHSHQGETDTQPQVVKRNRRMAFGLQLDKLGGIWSKSTDPITYITVGESVDVTPEGNTKRRSIKIYTVRKIAIDNWTDNQVELVSTDTSVEVDTETNRISKIQSHKTREKIVNLGDNVLAAKCDTTNFDENGLESGRSKYACLYKKIDQFKVKNEIDGTSVRSQFIKFLGKLGKNELEPTK
ncbi:MAG: hypothetical protein JSS83_25935 [Cyanobacteria bacterium SZAS LIN-3]|nr:hypothetical protein [Cyanobacteria bacterium SZAS LIN-3]